ncbi:hypothetical protein QQ045_000378 [Rhodiola kirilowii]
MLSNATPLCLVELFASRIFDSFNTWGFRPIALRDEEGCVLEVRDGMANLDVRSSLSIPLNVIDSGKCVVVETAEWNSQLAKLYEKAPTMIEMLSERNCLDLDIDGALPLATAIYAGQAPPQEIVAVVRPKCFTPSPSNTLEQKYIVNDGSEMTMEVKFFANSEDFSCSEHVYSIRRYSSTRRGVDGLYIFPLGSKLPDIFTKAGRYTFSFIIKNSDIKSFEAKVDVDPSPMATKWKVSSSIQYPWKLRIGQCHPNFDLTCYDEYGNRIPFSCMPKVDMALNLKRSVSCKINVAKMELSHDKLTLHFKDVTIESNELDQIRPNYEATLVLSSPDALLSVNIPCQVTPGPLQNVEVLPKNFGDNLYPGCVIEQFELEFFDAYGKHALGGSVAVILDGFAFLDNVGSKREIDEQGCLNLSGILKVTAEHEQNVSISLISESEVLRKMAFQTNRSILKFASEVEVIQAPSAKSENIHYQSVDGKFPPLVQAIMNSLDNEEEELLKAVIDIGKGIGVIEEELNILQVQKKEIEQDLLALQERQPHTHVNSSPETKQVMNVIKSKSESAASLVYYLQTRETLEDPFKTFMADVVGIVSHLGVVRSKELSRVLAAYLGEDQMLAVVCRTGDATSALQKSQDENAVATTLGKSILRQFDVICLEDIRPFTGEYVPCDYQMALFLRNPTLENGDSPAGFLGYAVNMVNLEISHMQIRTRTGHGLRETLFYRLFGELQVYETMNHMKQASACGCLNQTAVSLDGGIARGNGVFTYGIRNPEVCFPVVTLESSNLSQDEREILKKTEENRMELIMKYNQIMWLTDIHKKSKKIFKRKSSQYKKFMDQKGYLLREGRLLAYKDPGSSSNSA